MEHRLSADLTERVQALARQHRLTVNTLVQGEDGPTERLTPEMLSYRAAR